MTNATYIDLVRTYSDKHYAVHDFGVVDGKGRVIGSAIFTCVETRETVERPKGPYGNGDYKDWVGSKFVFVPSATRNGVEYGASQARQYFDTAAERDAAIAKYLANAAKRAAKRAGN